MSFLDVGPGWAVLMALLYYVDPMGCFFPFLAAAVFHELGHLAALLAFHVPIRRLRLRLSGAALETGPMSYRQELFCALAGPAANLLLLPLGRYWPRLATLSLLLALFNLLPFPPLDGGRALRAALSLRLRESTVARVLSLVTILCALSLAALSLWAALALQGGLWPILTAALILLRAGLELFPPGGGAPARDTTKERGFL